MENTSLGEMGALAVMAGFMLLLIWLAGLPARIFKNRTNKWLRELYRGEYENLEADLKIRDWLDGECLRLPPKGLCNLIDLARVTGRYLHHHDHADVYWSVATQLLVLRNPQDISRGRIYSLEEITTFVQAAADKHAEVSAGLWAALRSHPLFSSPL